MELRQIKELMAAMARTGTKRLRIKQENFEIELERERRLGKIRGEAPSEFIEAEPDPLFIPGHSSRQKTTDIPSSLHSPHEAAELAKEEVEGVFITSPMVGTFYAATDPEDPPFVKVGEKVTKDTVVCIIEAMKVMNEVKAGVDGTVLEVFVEDSHPVEFGTKLFRIF